MHDSAMLWCNAGNEDLVDVVTNSDLTALLLDMCELALHQVGSPADAQGSPVDLSGCDQLWASLTALQAVLDLHAAAPPMTLDLCCDLMLLYTDIAQVGSWVPYIWRRPCLQCHCALLIDRMHILQM